MSDILMREALQQVADVGGMDAHGFASANALANADALAQKVKKALAAPDETPPIEFHLSTISDNLGTLIMVLRNRL